MKKKPKKPRVAPIWFIGGPLDNTVDTFVWQKELALRIKVGRKHEEVYYRLEKLGTNPAHPGNRTLKHSIDVSFFEELEFPAQFYAYVHVSVTHAELVERVYLGRHQPECRFDLDRSEIELDLWRVQNREPLECEGK